MSASQDAFAFLNGTGEMAARIRAFDWSASLGPMEYWPISLRTSVGILVNAPTPMVLLWGEDGIMIYNDAYAAISGPRHPALLGSRVRDGWPEVADFNDHVMKVVLSGGTLQYKDRQMELDRGGRPESAWFDLAYSPVHDESGRPGGVMAIVIETTGRVLAERRRAAEEERQRQLFQQAPGFVIVMRGPGHVVEFVNNEHRRVFNSDGWLGKTIREAFPSIEGQGFFEVLDSVYATGTAQRFTAQEVRYRRSADAAWETRYFTFIYAPTYGDDGQVDGVFCEGVDVTDLHEVEAALRVSEDRLRLATKAAAIGTWDFNPQTGALRWDARCKELFGLPPEAEVTYESAFLAGLHPEDRERTHQAVQRAIAAGGSPHFDIEYRTVGLQDGIERWIAATGDALFEDGRAVRFVGTVRDISSRKHAERRFEIINRISAAVAAELDLDKIVQAVTDAGVELTGAEFGAFFYNVVDAVGESYMLYALSGAPKEAFARFGMPRNTAVFAPTFAGTGTMRSDDILQDPRYGRNAPHHGMPRGHLPVRSYLAVPVASRSGEVHGGLFFGHGQTSMFTAEHEASLRGLAGIAATAIDNARLFQQLQALNSTLEQRVAEEVAQRVSAEEQLRQSQKMEAIGQLTGGIAHDFNNMLSVVIGGLDLIQRRLARGDTNVQAHIEGAREGAARAASLTQRLLAFSRQQPLQPAPLDANRLVASMTDLLTRTLGEQVRIETVLASNLWRTFADPVQLESAVLNLAVNARDAMPEGGRLTIETANASIDDAAAREYALPAGQYVMVAVSDSGVGMSADVAARAFDPFFTTKPVGKGTGLGLSQVFGFVRQSGGHVKLYSEPDFGTSVKIYLPRFQGEREDDGVRSASARPEAGVPKELVLLVEDNEHVRAYSVEALQELGYQVVAAANGPEALRRLDEGLAVDLLFTDVVMPDMNGRQLADLALQRRPGLKVLFTTGYTRNAVVHKGVLDPGTAFLQKPFTIDQLASKIRSILDA
ncbi:MAG: PAS domain-containing protein [Pseudomonadota bacterium]